MHPWHDLGLGPRAPAVATAVVEIPLGSNVKYELDLETGLIKADRILRGPEIYPANYGFFPRTLGTDDDPLDVLILASAPLAPLTLAQVAPIGMFDTSSKEGREDKIVAVLLKDAAFESVRAFSGLPGGLLDVLLAFLRNYKTLEGEPVRVLGRHDAARARRAITEAGKRYDRRVGRPGRKA